MTEIRLESPESEIERDILRAFGWSIIEFEGVLFQKFLLIAGLNTIMTLDTFRKHLSNMESKGYVAPLRFQGIPSWKKLVVEDRIEDTLHPRRIEKRTPSEGVKRVDSSEHIVTDTKILAEDIIKILKGKLFPGRRNDEITDRVLRKHVMEMRRALSESEEHFLHYLDEYLAVAKPELTQILRARGEDLVMLSLRLAESHHL
jgi:hypothetical protein